jgi:type I restriction enzyme S subunit
MVVLPPKMANGLILTSGFTINRRLSFKKSIENYLSGSAQPQLPIKDLVKIPILIPENEVIIKFSKLANKIQLLVDSSDFQNQKLKELKDLLLSKLATVE